jgi:hypothetical protein
MKRTTHLPTPPVLAPHSRPSREQVLTHLRVIYKTLKKGRTIEAQMRVMRLGQALA